MSGRTVHVLAAEWLGAGIRVKMGCSWLSVWMDKKSSAKQHFLSHTLL
jgi:hypothetical protein